MTEQISIEEWRKLTKAQPKYGNARVVFKGIDFDSTAEAARYGELLLMQSAGAISCLVLQPSYELQAAFRDSTGALHRAIRYVGDFAYVEQGRTVVEDTKGMSTQVFKIKEKMFRFRYPEIDLRILGI